MSLFSNFIIEILIKCECNSLNKMSHKIFAKADVRKLYLDE